MVTSMANGVIQGMGNDHRRVATIMGIGSAVPKNVFEQNSFPDYFFDITNSNHMIDLKAKFAKICEKTMIEKRHLYLSDNVLRTNPPIAAFKSPSLNIRQELTDEAVPRLGMEAALAAIKDWGQKASDITHLIFCTTSSGCMPGADFEVTKLLGLPPSTKRFMMYHAGCHGGGTALRLAMDIAENNSRARVLILCSEVSTMYLRGPSESHVGNLLGQAMFGDAAGAIIVGADPLCGERPLFELVSASQQIIPGSEGAIVTKLYEEGLVFNLHQDVPMHISSNIKKLVQVALHYTTAYN